jgi:outer membrane protein assembly factor BamE (lipoprotein component of BamABCDE complex)
MESKKTAKCAHDLIVVAFVAVGLTSCTYEDRAAVTIDGREFPAQHARCVTKGMSTVDVGTLLGEPLRTTVADHQRRWIYRQVSQRESIDRVFGIIPIKTHAKPQEMRVVVTFYGGRVASVDLGGIPFSCGEFGPPPIRTPQR